MSTPVSGLIDAGVAVVGTGAFSWLLNRQSRIRTTIDQALETRFKRLEQYMEKTETDLRSHEVRITRIESMLQTLTLVMPALRDLFHHDEGKLLP